MALDPSDTRRRIVHVTILYWQPRELGLLADCLESLLKQRFDARFELQILVVDNGCGLLPRLPTDARIDVLRLADNCGFAGGHNVGLRRAISKGAEWVLLFNSDAIAEVGCLAELLAAGEADTSAACVGPLVLRATSAGRIESAGQSFNTATGRHREIARGQSAASIGDLPRRVDAVSGCALLARTSAVESIGLLDESLFAYFEDMEWCLRARQAGYSVMMVPRARVRHLGGGSTGSNSVLSTYYSVRNHMVVAGRYGGRMPETLAVAYQLAYVLRSPARRSRRHLVALAQAAVDAWAGRLGARRYGAHRH